MVLRISDVTELDHNAEFRSDVQISHFRTEANSGLVRSYMFTAGSFPEKKSSAEVLRLLREAAIDDIENRFVVQATYGRGKSHFGLAVANYFGKPADSPEVELLLKKLEHAYNESASVEPFRSFKKHRKPYLVVLLRGDTPSNLRDQFFRELENALRAIEDTKDVSTPFWFDEALRFINSLTPEQSQQADRYLDKHRLDLPTLRKKVEQRETSTYSICVELFKTVIGFMPNFGGETSLSDAIGWVVKELCIKQALIGGLLILFDEFSEFVRSYSSLHPIGMPLQELLNGVEGNRNKVLFVALSQHEPEKVAKNDGTVQYASLVKELTRLPYKNRYWLHSTLEDVLGAYFKPNIAHWKQVMKEPGVRVQVANASEIAYEAFSDRYKQVLHWSAEEFQEKVTRECFPLHPLTTVLLSSVDFEAASTTRSVLGFLTDDDAPLKQKLAEPAVLNGKPNWILPIALVDYFQDMLGEQVWQQYQQVDLPDLEPQQKAVLKAMVLQKAANIPTRAIGFGTVIGELSGLPSKQADEILKQLEEQRYIRFDSANRIYSFWSGSNAAIELERLLNQELAELERRGQLKAYLDEFDTHGQNKVNKLFASDQSPLYRKYPVNVDWGHPDDWAAQLVVLTRSSWTVHVLERLTALYSASLADMPDCRGLVLLPIARNQDDLDWFAEHIQKVLDTSAKLKAAPLVVISPNRPTPELISSLQKYALLSENWFLGKTVKQIGTTVMQEEKDRIAKQILLTLTQLHKDAVLEASADARGQIRALSIGVGASDRIERILREVYRIAYHKHPGDFYTHYRHTTPTLRNAVQDLIPVLMTNNLAGAAVGLSKVAKEIVDKFLASSIWTMFNPKQQIQPPKATHPHKAWERLDGSIPSGKDWIPLKEVLLELLNVPYGYDHNSLALLFSAWLGFYRRDLQLAVNGRIVGIDSATGEGNKVKPKEFIELWANAHLRRKDRKKLLEDIEEAVDKVNAGGLALDDAEAILGKLKASANENDITDPTLLDNAKLALKKLENGLGQLENYDQEIRDIEENLGKATTIQSLSNLLNKVGKLREPIIVASNLAKASELRMKVLGRVEEITEHLCQVNERLTDIRQYGRQEEALKRALEELTKLKLAEPAQRVQQALKTLEQEQVRLEDTRKTDAILVRINMIDASGKLAKLRKDLKELESFARHESDEVRKAAVTKKDLLTAEVARLESFILGLDKQIDTVDSVQAARDLERAILRERNHFEDTADIRDIEAAEERLGKLISFFRELGGGLPQSPEEADRFLDRLSKLPQEYQDYLSEGQKQKAEARIQEIQGYVQAQREEALRWLEDCRRRLAGGKDLSQLEADLARPYPFLPEASQTDLIELRQQLAARRTAQLQEEQILKRIADMPSSGPLADLLRRRQELGALTGSDRIVAAAAQKREVLDQALQNLEAQAREWTGALAGLTSSREIEALRDRINKALGKYEDTEWYETLETLSQRCKAVSDLLGQVEGKPALQTLEAAQQRIAQLEEIRNASALSEAQQQVVSAAIERVRAYISDQEAKAIKWLQDIEQELSKSRPEVLNQKLQQVPAFLPESELGHLEELRTHVETAVKQAQRDKEIHQLLRSLPRVTTLRELRNQHREVSQWLDDALGSEVRQALTAKIEGLQGDIQKLLENLANYRILLDQATDFTHVRRLVADLKDFASRLTETTEAEEANGLLSRADRLGDYLDNLRTFKAATLESPSHADQQIADIKNLNELYQDLGEAHRKAGLDLVARIMQVVEMKRVEAREWLVQRKVQIEHDEQLEVVEAELNVPPPFLSDEDRNELATLRILLRQKLDQNARNRIEQLFIRMSPSERQACLTRLNQLLQEELA